MKILMLTPYLPFPLYSGGQIRTYNLLKNLADRHQVTLVSFYRQDQELQYVNELKKFCFKVLPIKRRKTWGLKNILLAGLSFYPFLVATYISREAKAAVEHELNSGQYDLIHMETFYLMPNLPKTRVPILLVEQTIEYLVYQRYVQNSRIWPLKPFLYLDVLKIKLWEYYFWKKANYLAAMSTDDLAIMLKSGHKKEGGIVANGVDIDFFEKKRTAKTSRPTVLFVGNFKWLPNKDAAIYLVEEIWPLIKKQVPQAKLWIVGRNPTETIKKYNRLRDVRVGQVPDIRDAFAQADVLLAPIRNGRGTKYKVLEAMAAGVPVVTTPLGAQGIEARPGKEIIIANTTTDLAQQASSLLKSKNKDQQLARLAKKLVKDKYNWPNISQRLDQIYQKLGGA